MLQQQNLYDAGGWFISSEVRHLPRASGNDHPRGVGHRELVERGLRACTADHHNDEHHHHLDHNDLDHHDNDDNHHDEHDDHNVYDHDHGPRDHDDGGSAINHNPTTDDYTGAPNDDDAIYYVHLQFNDDIHDLDHGGPDDDHDDYDDDRRPHYDFEPTPNHYSFHNDFNDDDSPADNLDNDLDHDSLANP